MYGSHVIWPPGCNVELRVGEAILSGQTVLLGYCLVVGVFSALIKEKCGSKV